MELDQIRLDDEVSQEFVGNKIKEPKETDDTVLNDASSHDPLKIEEEEALYYCTIISRDELKLPIPRDNNFSSQGAKPRGMNKLSPEGLAISKHPEK